MVFSTSKALLRFKCKKRDKCLCGLLDIRTGVMLVSFAALIVDAFICYVSLFPRWLDINFETIQVPRTSFLNPRMAGVIIGSFGIITSIILFIGNRCNEHIYVLFLIARALVIIYSFYAAFVFLFRALLLVEEKGDIRASKRYIEASLLILTSLFNIYFAAVVSSG